jgi:hypothetical protein
MRVCPPAGAGELGAIFHNIGGGAQAVADVAATREFGALERLGGSFVVSVIGSAFPV